jgi:hypothetical protein
MMIGEDFMGLPVLGNELWNKGTVGVSQIIFEEYLYTFSILR